MPPELRGLALCRRCRHRDECAPFRDELIGAVQRIALLEHASKRRFGPYVVHVETEKCLSVVRNPAIL
jgi:hypothetical protein